MVLRKIGSLKPLSKEGAMLNIVLLTGNLGKDPEVFMTQTGREIVKFSLATSYVWKDAEGEWHKHRDWHSIVILRRTTAQWVKDVLKKGDGVCVEGRLTYREREGGPPLPQIIVSGTYGNVELTRSQNSVEIIEDSDDPFGLTSDSFSAFLQSNQQSQQHKEIIS